MNQLSTTDAKYNASGWILHIRHFLLCYHVTFHMLQLSFTLHANSSIVSTNSFTTMDNELIIKANNISSVTGMYQLAATNVYGTVYTTGQLWESCEFTHELLQVTLITDKYRILF